MLDESAAELVERLTREGLESLRDDVANGRRDTGLKSLDERGAMSEIVRDQYTGRYPLELIQNANDAEASEGSIGGSVKFVVTEAALLVADQGAGFGVDQVNAICGLARSSKDPRKNVGYKGLGFKSVREITDRPQIISCGVRFGFDSDRLHREVEAVAGQLPDGQRLPDYAFPFTLTDDDLGGDVEAVENLISDGFRTVMRLPFREPDLRERVAAHVADVVTSRLLLFLDATESLEIVGTSSDSFAQARREPKEGHEYLVLQEDGGTKEYLIFRRQLEIPDRQLVEGLGRAWQDVQYVRAIAAVPLGPDGPLGGVPEPLYVYFPTEEKTGFSLALHADFQMDLDRRRISRSTNAGAYNAWLREALADFVAGDVVPWLAQRYPGGQVLDALASYETPTGDGATLRERMLQRLRNVCWIPCRDGLRSPSTAWLLPPTVPDLRALHSWLPEERPYVIPAVEQKAEVRSLLNNELSLPVKAVRRLLAELDPPDGDVEVEEFYRFLVDWNNRQALFAASLESARCVRLRGGTWVTPHEPAFLPRQRNETDFPAELNIPIVNIPDLGGLGELLESAGVKLLSWRTVVTDFLMPLLSDVHTHIDTRETALAALRTYYDSMRGETGDQSIREAVQKVLLPVRCVEACDDSQYFAEAREIYFGRDWLHDSELEAVYGPFDESEFLDLCVPDDRDELQSSRAFYSWLGVADRPRVILASDEVTAPTAWRRSKEFGSTWKDPQGHPASQILFDPQIDRIHELVRSSDRSRVISMWHELAKHWAEYSSQIETASWRCSAAAHKGERKRSLQSSTAFVLRETACIPVVRDDQSYLARPKDVWRPASDAPARVRRLISLADPAIGHLSAAMTEWLGFVALPI